MLPYPFPQNGIPGKFPALEPRGPVFKQSILAGRFRETASMSDKRQKTCPKTICFWHMRQRHFPLPE